MEERRQEQEAQKAQHMQSANNIGMARGELDLESPFLEIYESEQDHHRNLGHLEPLTADDFVIEEGTSYAFSLIRDFLKNKKILIDSSGETVGDKNEGLRPVEVHDNGDSFSVKYEHIYEVD